MFKLLLRLKVPEFLAWYLSAILLWLLSQQITVISPFGHVWLSTSFAFVGGAIIGSVGYLVYLIEFDDVKQKIFYLCILGLILGAIFGWLDTLGVAGSSMTLGAIIHEPSIAAKFGNAVFCGVLGAGSSWVLAILHVKKAVHPFFVTALILIALISISLLNAYLAGIL